MTGVTDYNAGQAYLTILPSLDKFGDRVREQLKQELGDGVDLPVKPRVEPGEGEKQGAEFGGAFGEAARKRIDAALKALPKAEIDADSDPAARKIDELRTRLEELRDKRIGVDISGEAALAELRAIHSELDDVGRKSPDVTVRANTAAAMAEVAALNREIKDLDGKRASFDVSDSGSAASSTQGLNALALAGAALGPAIIPVAAAAAAAVAAIGTGAVVGIAALGAIKLGTSGISSAVQALDTQQTQQGQNALQLHAQQVSSANSVASAQDGLRNAVTAVGDAQRAAGIANTHAVETENNARRALEDTVRSNGIAYQNALDTETRAEETLQAAEESETLAQNALTNAREAAQRQIESLTLAVEDGALAERQATLSIGQAKLNLDKTLANPTATVLQREQAQLTYDQSVQQLKDVQNRNKNLAEDKAKADKAGVNGSTQVMQAQRGVDQAVRATTDAQRALGNATANVTEVKRAGDERAAVAEQTLRDATAARLETARAGAESVSKAQQGVIAAQRSLNGALASAAASAAAASAANQALKKSLDNLSPAGREFARFIFSLKPELKDLQATAQAGLLPGVEAGIRNFLPVLPQYKGLIGDVSLALGNMAANTGAALNSPFWVQWIQFIRGEATPSLHIFGATLGNLATGGAAILQAFKPVWDQMGAGVLDWSTKFATASQNLKSNPAFLDFLQYVKTEGPVVVHTIGDLVVTIVRLGEDLAPLGGFTIRLVDGIAKLVGWLAQANPGLVSFAGGLFSGGLLLQKMIPMLTSAVGSGGSFVTMLTGSATAGGKFTAAGEKVTGALGKIGSALPIVGVALIALDAIWTSAVTSTDEAAAAFLKGGAAAAQMGAKLDDELTGFGKWANGFLHFAATSDDATKAMEKQRAAMDPLTRSQSDATRAQNDYLNALQHGGPTSAAAVDAQSRYASATAETTHQQDLLARGLNSTTDALKKQQEQVLGAVDADIRYEDALQRTRDAIQQNGAATDIHTAAGRANLTAFLDLIKATQADEDEMRKNGASIDELNTKHREHVAQLQGVAGQLGLTGQEAQRYIGTLQGVPLRIDTQFLANTIPAVGAVNQMATDINNAVRGITDEQVNIVFHPGALTAAQTIAGALPRAAGGAIYGPGTATSDSVPVMASHGEHMWSAAEVSGAGGHSNVIALRQQARSGALHLAAGGPVSWSESSNFGALGVPETVALNVSLIRQAADQARQQAAQAEVAPSSSPGVAHWRPISLQALAIAGQDASNLGRLEMQMASESGGNPTAINRSDINWQHGTPSIGLMQVIGPTYARYKHPGYDAAPFSYGVSEDPLSNILAATRYTLGAYGSLASGWKGHGYDTGGILPPGMTLANNGTGVNEHVLTGDQFSNLTGAVGSGGGPVVNVNVYPRAEHSEADIADMVSHRLALALRTH